MARKRKISVIDLMMEYGVIAYDDGKKGGLNCTRLTLENLLPVEELEKLKRWKNIEISEARYRWAPEIRSTVIYVYDKCIA